MKLVYGQALPVGEASSIHRFLPAILGYREHTTSTALEYNRPASATATSQVANQSTIAMRHVAVPITQDQFDAVLDAQERTRYLKTIFQQNLPSNFNITNDHLPRLNIEEFITDAPSDAKNIISSVKISNYLSLHKNPVEENTTQEKRPLVIMFPWLMSKQGIVNKYIKLYTQLGFHVLQAQISPLDLLLPVQRAQVCADEVLDFLVVKSDVYDRYLTHGFSVGAYTLTEVLIKISGDLGKYAGVKSRFAGQIYDSPCELPGIREGVIRSVSDSKAVQDKMVKVLDWFLEHRYEAATKHYVRTQQFYDVNYCGVPALFLYSLTDPISAAGVTTKTINSWHQQGFQVYSHIFKDSPHVGHYPRNKKEYAANIYAFIKKLGLY